MRIFTSQMLILSALALTPLARAQSLYNETTYRPLTADHRARQAGDILTVLVYESSSASTTADTAVKRRSDVGISAGIDERNHKAAIGTNNQFDGGGTVQRSGRLLAQLSVTVIAVSDMGDLQISGEQDVEINSDRQHFKLEGRVRPVDVSSNNTVASNRIADARISYLGDGDLAERQRPGMWAKVMTWLGF